MARPKVLIFDSGGSILSNLTHVLDSRRVRMEDEPEVFAVANLAESRALIEQYAGQDDVTWKAVVIAREGGMESAALEATSGLRAQFSPHTDIPVLLVSKANASMAAALQKRLPASATLLSVDGDVDFDLIDTNETQGHMPDGAEAKFDALTQKLADWAASEPASARAVPRRRH